MGSLFCYFVLEPPLIQLSISSLDSNVVVRFLMSGAYLLANLFMLLQAPQILKK
jgi:hypothetical protein